MNYLTESETDIFFSGKIPVGKILITQEAATAVSSLPVDAQAEIKNFLLSLNQEKKVRARSKLFRALGKENPPAEIMIRGRQYSLEEIFKHDSWAATALYNGPAGKIVCKFNRRQPIFGLPMQWLGNRLAQRENKFLTIFADLPNLPKYSGEVIVNGKVWPNVSAHAYVEGTPLRQYKKTVRDDFFPTLQKILKIIHAQNISYMDLNKQENILVMENGEPCLIDFQICFHLSKRWPGNSAPMRWLLGLLQQSDTFHLMKHFTRLRPDLFTPETLAKATHRPWFLNVYRCVQIPLRTARRKLLTLLGFRNQSGQVTSETFVEHGIRQTAPAVAGYQLILINNHKTHFIEFSALQQTE